MTELLTIKEASQWASEYLNKDITNSNISYLIQYGKLKKYGANGKPSVNKYDLISYYDSYTHQRKADWKQRLGDDLNWDLSFDYLKEKETTKHVHRLHPYKGKFIPQLVEYFLDTHTDNFKKQVYFKEGDIVLDPFAGSGTTLVQACELGIHALGIDVSHFNALISNVKVGKVDFEDLEKEVCNITLQLKHFISSKNNVQFENELLKELILFNKQYFPSPKYKVKVKQKEINEKEYATEKEVRFSQIYNDLLGQYEIEAKNENPKHFLEKWYLKPVKIEIDFVFDRIQRIKNTNTKKIVMIILSRTIRSCRATTHADLATLKEPVTQTYYCRKHGKICKPIFSILSWWERYSKDTIKRLDDFSRLRTETHQYCIQGDARCAEVLSNPIIKNAILKTKHLSHQVPTALFKLIREQKVRGIFSSPPYVGLIDYHEQHAYAYDLFGLERSDENEIGPLNKGQGKKAREWYVEGISDVLSNSKTILQPDYDVFLVANDKYGLYPTIAEKSGMKIVNQHKRPVLNRTEKDKSPYAEIIFHLKER
ncbi:MAG: DNA methyltransferase [Flavobacteriaceae bacterium]|nr:DNA methyltransferase [Flavobacteriaceae bacterium]